MTTQTIILLFLGGLVLLILGAELLVQGASRLAVDMGISPLVVGMTVVAYGTSAPEVAVTVQAMYANPPQPELAIGNVVGSNISNVLLVLGLASIAVPLIVSKTLVRVTVPIMIAVTGLAWWMCLDGMISRFEGIVLLIGAILFSVISVARSRRATFAAAAQYRQDSPPEVKKGVLGSVPMKLLAIIVGLAMLVLGARWLIEGATEVARLLKISELIVGLTVVAVGTSLPEIATSLIAGLRGHRDLAVGNVVGSNIFNLLLVLGFCATVAPQSISVPQSALQFDIPVMFLVALACWPIFYTDWLISRWEGLLLLSAYLAYTVTLYMMAVSHNAIDAYVTTLTYGAGPLIAIGLLLLTVRHWRSDVRNRSGHA